MKDKLAEADKDELKKMAAELKELASKDDFDKQIVKDKTAELSKKLQEKGAAMYKQAADEVEKEQAAEGEVIDKEEPEKDSEDNKKKDKE